MNALKKAIALLSVLVVVTLCAKYIDAAEYSSDLGGFGYAEARRAPRIAPAVALGTLAIVAIVAVAIQGQGGHGHGVHN